MSTHRSRTRPHPSGPTSLTSSAGPQVVSYLTTLSVTDEVEAVVDINRHKHGKFLAGTGHEIVAPELLQRLRPDCVVIMNGIVSDGVDAPRRHRCAKVAVLKNRYEGGARGRG